MARTSQIGWPRLLHADRWAYGNAEQGAHTLSWVYRYAPDPPAFYQLRREATCDVQGRFRFTDVADGTFYLETQIAWIVPTFTDNNNRTGADLMLKVAVGGGQTREVVLAP